MSQFDPLDQPDRSAQPHAPAHAIPYADSSAFPTTTTGPARTTDGSAR
jgi:hypothetical protein